MNPIVMVLVVVDLDPQGGDTRVSDNVRNKCDEVFWTHVQQRE